MDLVFDIRLSDSPIVDMIWHTHSEKSGNFTSTAECCWEMVITKYQGKTSLTIRGPETKATPANYPADMEFFGISFKLGTYIPQLPILNRLDRNDITLPEATNNAFWLNGSAWQFPEFENADIFVNRLVRDGLLIRDPVVEAVLQDRPVEMSPRAIQYRFVQATGLTYKTIQQIQRAKQAMTLLQQGIPILDTTYEMGYFDQPHLTRSLKRFAGQTPAQIRSIIMPSASL